MAAALKHLLDNANGSRKPAGKSVSLPCPCASHHPDERSGLDTNKQSISHYDIGIIQSEKNKVYS